MKSRLKVLMAACAVVGAFAAIPAAAHAETMQWYVNGSALSGSKVVTGGGGEFKLASKIGKTAVTIACSETSFTGHITAPGANDESINFTGCSVEGAPACAVTSVHANAVTALSTVNGVFVDTFNPVGAEPFATIVIEECALEGEYEVYGKTAGFDPNAEEESTEHTVEFSGEISEAAGTVLHFGGPEGPVATLTGSATAMLEGGASFSAH